MYKSLWRTHELGNGFMIPPISLGVSCDQWGILAIGDSDKKGHEHNT